ncbi:hypothetical protein HPGCJGGD_3761 [Methylobacterium haplocladii]|nr:hypothetical protein HPGCJGGD_3761 [Methylobacterium haplocladii]
MNKPDFDPVIRCPEAKPDLTNVIPFAVPNAQARRNRKPSDWILSFDVTR